MKTPRLIIDYYGKKAVADYCRIHDGMIVVHEWFELHQTCGHLMARYTHEQFSKLTGGVMP